MTKVRSASPRAGRSLEGLVAPLREHVLAAVGVARKFKLDGSWIEDASLRDMMRVPLLERAAWAAVAITLVDMIRTGLPADGEAGAVTRRALDHPGSRRHRGGPRTITGMDPSNVEIAVMQDLWRKIQPLEQDARERVADWLSRAVVDHRDLQPLGPR